MNKNASYWRSFLEKLSPSTRTYLPDNKRKTWGLNLYYVRPFSLREATYASMLGRLLESSCAKYPSLLEISRREEELFGTEFYTHTESFGDRLVLSFHLRALRERYADSPLEREALEYLSEVLLFPNAAGKAFEQSTFDVERERLFDELASFKKDPMNLVYAGALRGALLGELGNLPIESEEILREMTPESLWNYYEEILSDSASHLLVKGLMPEEEDGRIAPLPPMETPLREGRQVVELSDFSQSLTVQMYATPIRAGDPRSLSLFLFTMIWGSGASSRLFETVREKLGLCYGISADYSRTLGLVSVTAAFERKEFEALKNAVAASLDNLLREGVPAEVFAGIKREVRTALISRSETISGALAERFYRSLLGGNPDLQQRLRELEEVSEEDVLSAGATLRLHSGFTLLGGQA